MRIAALPRPALRSPLVRSRIRISILVGLLLLQMCSWEPSAWPQTPQPCASCATGATAPSPQAVAATSAQELPPIDGDSAEKKPKCLAATREITCKADGSGYLYSFTVTNNTGQPVTHVLVTPPGNSNFTITPQMPPLPGGVLANGQSVTLQVSITGGQAGQQICFSITLMTGKKTCCTVSVCVVLPNCCATVKDQKIECNQNGSFTYTLSVTNNTPDTVQHIYLYPPPGVVMTPSYFAVNLAPGATSPALVITITGAQPGKAICFDISLHTAEMKSCCTFEHCIELPKCNPNVTACRDGVCCSRAPAYNGTTFTGQKVAAVTGWRNDPAVAQSNVLTVFDISGANAFTTGGSSSPNNAPPQFNGPATSRWTLQNLGSIFGVTIDHVGNIYVTASSAYGSDSYPGGPGRIFKIQNGTGAIDTVSFKPNLPNFQDTSTGGYPALGNIAFECSRKQFFVTNEEDGRIYRLDYNGNVLSTFDHATGIVTNNGNPEAGDPPGFAPLGERLWGVQVHNNRVYYSLWNEDCAHKNANVKNQIWSVGLNVLGDFDPNTKKLEFDVPDLPGEVFSNPVSDISFSRDGRMLITERTMGCSGCDPKRAPTTPNAHASRVLEYLCTLEGWSPASPFAGIPYKYGIGIAATAQCPISNTGQPANAAGGIDYDYDPLAKFQVWATGDILTNNPLIYGVQALPFTGGTFANSALTGLYGTGSFKTQIGDVEVSCPPGGAPY